ncbi:MAG: hypothetical protein A3E36_02275 [Candidatus Andersenbacteria bacterium RIFCSPHIGHO2_12_FULL_45_11b]|uniref:DUF883 domain-containing protein n=1 Tax=Candidatus Andersenbacteria bacterium RIFCSPHIGHO2_12_FULL_45_11b TaxID=1797282 RepID=A0A1G1XDA6_9BACT|nr:MAG: hypothetical protein A3E36_02275 [Candidatus Andersenbacteria bacterium RIFCSPHIGHO2_12_FULL_45_11b]
MTNEQIAQKIERITKEFQELGSQISELTAMSTERLEEYRNEAMSDIHAKITDTSREVKKQVKVADEYAHQNPWAIVAGFSVAGLVLGILLSQISSKK